MTLATRGASLTIATIDQRVLPMRACEQAVVTRVPSASIACLGDCLFSELGSRFVARRARHDH